MEYLIYFFSLYPITSALLCTDIIWQCIFIFNYISVCLLQQSSFGLSHCPIFSDLDICALHHYDLNIIMFRDRLLGHASVIYRFWSNAVTLTTKKIMMIWFQFSTFQIWFANVPHPKLVEYKKDQNWVQTSGDYLVFPGGGTQFKEGVTSYIQFLEQVLCLLA